MIASDACGKQAYYRSQSHCSGRSNGFSIRMTRLRIDALRKIVFLIIIIFYTHYNCIMDRDINFRSFEPATPRQMINISRGMRKNQMPESLEFAATLTSSHVITHNDSRAILCAFKYTSWFNARLARP